MLLIGCIVGGVVLVFLATALVGAPYVPTHRKEVSVAFDSLYPMNKTDTLLDIGSGDGVVLAEACRRGARAIGYEINPFLVWVSRWRLRKYGARARVETANFWTRPFPTSTTVVYTFGESRDIAKMYAKVRREAARLDKDLMFISYAFAVPGVHHVKHQRAYYLYKVPALHSERP